jgi:hypothetical protein
VDVVEISKQINKRKNVRTQSMMTRLLLAFAVIGLVVANAKTYGIDLYQPAMLGSIELAPGHYDVDVADMKAVFRNGRIHGEAPVKMEDADMKYNRTSVVLANNGGQMHIQEIHIAGTKVKLVFVE